MKTNKDILGREDINNLLGLYPDIERKNFKLWLTSTTVLEKILHSNVYNRSQAELEYIQRKIRFYVQNDSFEEALEILEKHHCCIISGIPGIGKTTLAEILLIHYLDKGYEIVTISSNIKDAFSTFQPKTKQAFYYDDFLGQTNLQQRLEKNEDQDLLRFIESVKRSKEHRLVLTTREYLFNQAKESYEKIRFSKVDLLKCIVDLSKYTPFIRAKILFNHLFFSEMPKKFISNLLRKREYWRILRHPNFSPRIIEWMTIHVNTSVGMKRNYVKIFLDNLNNPHRIWENAFRNQISESSRSVLLTLFSLPDEVLVEDLEKAYRAHHELKSEAYKFSCGPQDFKKSIKELEGNFVSIEVQGGCPIIQFHNPSIKDFLENYLVGHVSELQYLISSILFFDQSIILWKYDRLRCMELFDGIFIEKVIQKIESADCELEDKLMYRGSRYLGTHKIRSISSLEKRISVVVEIVGDRLAQRAEFDMILDQVVERIKSGNVDDIGLDSMIKELDRANLTFLPKVKYLLANAKMLFLDRLDDLERFEYCETIRKIMPVLFSNDDVALLSETFEEAYIEIARDFAFGEYVPEEISSFSKRLSRVALFLGKDDDKAQEILSERISEIEEEDEEREDANSEYRRENNSLLQSDLEIESMFDSLR